ncbi:hypothetical protein [Pedobacter sp. GR22-10]|uniref:hypothetical protein n=1 Tax=Pedobacter sp. GR22-10 TaxID=2994472 RepID=UPI0022486369|nr:hypothetical protein [Pedobacter sp. GR22-10]MCX2429619.1 hypothetical protein [Pedobacter sp. GR22-10]
MNSTSKLDFKREEYNEQNKEDMIKNMLAFTDADTEKDRYIIMGVEKINGKVTLSNVSAKYDSAKTTNIPK